MGDLAVSWFGRPRPHWEPRLRRELVGGRLRLGALQCERNEQSSCRSEPLRAPPWDRCRAERAWAMRDAVYSEARIRRQGRAHLRAHLRAKICARQQRTYAQRCRTWVQGATAGVRMRAAIAPERSKGPDSRTRRRRCR
jgi:hypothetical protein